MWTQLPCPCEPKQGRQKAQPQRGYTHTDAELSKLSGCFEFTQQTRESSRNSSKGVPLWYSARKSLGSSRAVLIRIVADPQQALRLVFSRALSCRLPCASD